jgi:hypothetical protein
VHQNGGAYTSANSITDASTYTNAYPRTISDANLVTNLRADHCAFISPICHPNGDSHSKSYRRPICGSDNFTDEVAH